MTALDIKFKEYILSTSADSRHSVSPAEDKIKRLYFLLYSSA